VVFLVACAPSQTFVQTAIVNTQIASTKTQAALATSTPTLTPTMTPTATYTMTPTATPDIRIFDTNLDPRDYLVNWNDLPPEGKYYFPNSEWMSINTNDEVIVGRGIEKGRQYVIETGRITGWWKAYARGTRAVQMPDEIQSGVYLFKTIEGAQLAVTKFNSMIAYPEDNYKKVEFTSTLGDVNFADAKIDNYSKETIMEFEFSVRNIMVSIVGYGFGDDVKIEFLISVGQIVYDKLKNAPLIAPPTSTGVFLESSTPTH
jgi:hypothetical protein